MVIEIPELIKQFKQENYKIQILIIIVAVPTLNIII